MRLKLGPYSSAWKLEDAIPVVGAFTHTCRKNNEFMHEGNELTFWADLAIMGYYHTEGYRHLYDLIGAGVRSLF